VITRSTLFTLVNGLGATAMAASRTEGKVVTIAVSARPQAIAVNSVTGAV